MSSDQATAAVTAETVIAARGLGKIYTIYRKPEDRLKQMVFRWKRYFDEYWALRDVTLDIRRGETVGIIGRNGSGKSTLLQMICSTLTPSTGELNVHGRIAGLLELGAGFNPEFTGRENVFLAATVLGLDDAQIAQRLDSILEFAGIGDFIDQPVKLYSSGMYARLAFAVAAHVDAEILVVDEILSVGDAAFTQKCMRFIRKFRETGTLLFVSHDTGAVINLCDRVIWIDRGQVREIGPAKEVCHNYHAALLDEEDDGSAFHIGGSRKAPPEAAHARDHRHEDLAPLNQDAIELFKFDPDAPWFGNRGATIEKVELLDASGQAPATLSGGEEVELRITCVASQALQAPIVGFYVRDRLGQELFGDNTYVSYRGKSAPVEAGERFAASFRFFTPYLPTGDYSVVAAVADGEQGAHEQHHWVDDALFFRVHASHVARGLLGIPMLDIRLSRHG